MKVLLLLGLWQIELMFSFLMFLIISLLFHLLQQSGQRVEVYRVGVDIEHGAIAVDEFVGGVAVDTDEVLDGGLLVLGQVVVDYVVAFYLVFLDDVLPRLVAAAVAEVEIDEVEVLQPLVFLLRVLEALLAGAAPRAPNIDEDELALVRFDNLA